jgi:organic hydroperoxide reductase OsmC/OhrA
MRIVAQVQNSEGKHNVNLQTDSSVHPLTIQPKSTGFGSSVNGGELLFLALATCYCNDIYREATQRGIKVVSVDVTVEGDFGRAGEPARNVMYSAKVSAQASESDIADLMKHTDTVAEIHNTLRVETPVRLDRIEAKSV